MSSFVTSLAEYCFSYNRYITAIDNPSYVTSLGENCFYDCPHLTNVTCEATKGMTISSLA